MTKTVKETKKDIYTQMIDIFNCIEGVETQKYIDFCSEMIGQLDRKASKAKETAEKKKAAGDELTDRIAEVLTDEFASVDDIVAAINDEAITRAKVIYRLSALTRDGRAEKSEASVTGSNGGRAHKIAIYRLAQ